MVLSLNASILHTQESPHSYQQPMMRNKQDKELLVVILYVAGMSEDMSLGVFARSSTSE